MPEVAAVETAYHEESVMKFQVPKDIDRWCASAEEALERKRASERRQDEKLERMREENIALWLEERPIRLDCGTRIFAWLLEAEKTGVRTKLGLGLPGMKHLTVWGPISPWGEPTEGYSGSYWVRLPLAGELGLILGHRLHACAGKETTLASVEAIADTMPTGICVHVAREIASGAVWERLREAMEKIRSAEEDVGS